MLTWAQGRCSQRLRCRQIRPGFSTRTDHRPGGSFAAFSGRSSSDRRAATAGAVKNALGWMFVAPLKAQVRVPIRVSSSRIAFYYQSGWCPGEACGPGGESAAQARTGEGPRCTTYAVQLHVSSARSDMPVPHRLHGFRHPLTNVGPSLKRTRPPRAQSTQIAELLLIGCLCPRALGERPGVGPT